ncbi:UDP-glucose 4-epimerase GalE [Verrucomicrobiales bacterium]|nr:UDP-glucose 4-epimerase GalE [Verrucomicrobiales bacterium]
MNVLVTGGAGYIGSHTIVELLIAGHEVIILDNFSNSSPGVVDRISQICNANGISEVPVILEEGDVRDKKKLRAVFSNNKIDSVLHFAGLKAIGESVEKPLDYYENNVKGSINLFQAMQYSEVYELVFSSTATVYGKPDALPLNEQSPIKEPTNPYSRTKMMVERILKDLALSDERWRIALLRYFNPVGAHPSGLIGENPNDIPNNLVPYISQVAIGKLEKLNIFGGDYPTSDGTGIRDYLHVVDLAKGHLKALNVLQNNNGANIWNLGTGQGYSVIEVLSAFEKAAGKSIPYQITSRRGGDIAAYWADPSKAKKELDWVAKHSLDQMMEDSWRWQKNNPEGYNN